jgi:hypothetical protein
MPSMRFGLISAGIMLVVGLFASAYNPEAISGTVVILGVTFYGVFFYNWSKSREHQEQIDKINSEKRVIILRFADFVLKTWGKEMSVYEKHILNRINESVYYCSWYEHDHMTWEEREEKERDAKNGVRPNWRWCSVYDLYYNDLQFEEEFNGETRVSYYKAIVNLERAKFIKTKKFPITVYTEDDNNKISFKKREMLYASIDKKGEEYLTKVVNLLDV